MTAVVAAARHGARRPHPPLVSTFGNCAREELGRAAALLGRADLVCPQSAELGVDLAAVGLAPGRQQVVAPGVPAPPAPAPGGLAALDHDLGLGPGPVVLAVGRLVPEEPPPPPRCSGGGDGGSAHCALPFRRRWALSRPAPSADRRARAGTERLPARCEGRRRRPHRASAPRGLRFGLGGSVAALEASAAGTPVVTTTCGIRELLADGAGRVVPAFDAAALAEAVVELLGDDERRRAMGRAAAFASPAATRPRVMVDAWSAVYATVQAGGHLLLSRRYRRSAAAVTHLAYSSSAGASVRPAPRARARRRPRRPAASLERGWPAGWRRPRPARPVCRRVGRDGHGRTPSPRHRRAC